MKKQYFIMWFAFLLFVNPLQAQQLHKLSVPQLIERQYVDVNHAEYFSSLQIQDAKGRIKPIHTMALDLLRKLTGKSTFTYFSKEGNKKKLTASQVFIGMHYKPDSWQLLPVIKVEKTTRDTIANYIKVDNGFSKPAHFFDFQGNYILKPLVDAAFAKPEGKRNTLDKNVIKLDERLNIVWTVFSGQFLRVFPNKRDPKQTWFAPNQQVNFSESDQLIYTKMIPEYLDALSKSIQKNNWEKPNKIVKLLHKFQKENASSNLLNSVKKVNLEISYNKQAIFFKCIIGYTLFGLFLLIVGFFQIFFNKKSLHILGRVLLILLMAIFAYHSYGIGLRWYISGHAPWTNGYEATIFIASVGVLAGIVFSKKTKLPAAATALIAVCLMGIAHGSLMNPEITNLVPVLKSYWLLIHVAIITGSYGFLTLGSILALLVLLCMVFTSKNNQHKITKAVLELTSINEKTTTIGLFMLSIGTFLGGIWANESWGRYWGWDPKETWALISIIIYAFVMHIRIIFKKGHLLIFNICSMFALSSLIMTFFGVNYYLSGLHSYAKGDPVPIPAGIYIVVPLLVCLSILAAYRWKKVEEK